MNISYRIYLSLIFNKSFHQKEGQFKRKIQFRVHFIAHVLASNHCNNEVNPIQNDNLVCFNTFITGDVKF